MTYLPYILLAGLLHFVAVYMGSLRKRIEALEAILKEKP